MNAMEQRKMYVAGAGWLLVRADIEKELAALNITELRALVNRYGIEATRHQRMRHHDLVALVGEYRTRRTNRYYSETLKATVSVPDAGCAYCGAEPVGRTHGPDIAYCESPAHRARAKADHEACLADEKRA
jgi:hypothetical protein